MKKRYFKGPITGRHVLYAMLAFFGVIFVVNGVFVYFARSTFTGMETDNAYRKGLAYNESIQAAESQHMLGWRVKHIDLNRDGQFEVRLVDRFGEPLRGVAVRAQVRRPVSEAYDQTAALVEQADGIYTTTIVPLAAGQWQVALDMQRGLDEFHVEERIVLP